MNINAESQKKQSDKSINKTIFILFQKINRLFLSVLWKITDQTVLKAMKDREIEHTSIILVHS